jgi:hypothetical protein
MRLTFKRSGHVYLNAGIVGLHDYLHRAKKGIDVPPKWEQQISELTTWSCALEDQQLWLESENPIPLLETMYFWMGEELYDNSTDDALKNLTNAYYVEAEDRFEWFPKKKTYGFGGLLTNDAAGKTPNEENTLRQKTIKEDDVRGQHILSRFKEEFEKKEVALGQQLYVNEPYAKITRLKLTDKDLLPGNKQCPLTGEGFKNLQSATSTSPTASGMLQFMSGVGAKTNKIGWKAMYLMRFAPRLELYRYANRLDTLYCYFYDAPTLLQLRSYYRRWQGLYYAKEIKQKARHLANFKLEPIRAKGIDAQLGARDFILPNEVLFQLLYTIASQNLNRSGDGETGQLDGEIAKVDFYLLRADKFAGTMRPSVYTVFNHFTYVQRYLKQAREFGVDWTKVLLSLVLSKPSNGKNDYELSRRLRDEVLRKIMNGESIAEEMARLLYDCYNLRISGGNLYYKSFAQLELLVRFNEFKSLNPHSMISAEVRERAYKLGVQIGENIMRAGDKNEPLRNRAKSSRKYIVHLNKVRTYDDFLESVVRIMTRFDGIVPSRDLFEKELTEENLKSIKLLTVIGALTRINSKLSRDEAKQKETTKPA